MRGGWRSRRLARAGVALLAIGLIAGSAGLLAPLPVTAAPPSNPPAQSGSIGLEGTISSKPPSRGATITIPGGGTVTSIPITVSGLCPTGLLVKIFDNEVFVGSVVCSGGSYSLQVDLFGGQNDLVARVYDALDQAGPDSNKVTVIFNDAQFLQLGTLLTLTSPYAERGAPPGAQLTWPVVLDGGTGPYAISVDWGDGTAADLMSTSVAGTVTLKHVYKTAGLYKVIVKATDKNGSEAFLQLVGQATGAIQNNKTGSNTLVQNETPIWPFAVLIPLIFVAFWLGGRHRLWALQHEYE